MPYKKVGISPQKVYLNFILSVFSKITKFNMLITGITKWKNKLLFINIEGIPPLAI